MILGVLFPASGSGYPSPLLLTPTAGLIFIMSSIRRIVMAASVANFRHFTLFTVGSRTPFWKLFTTAPAARSNPLNLASGSSFAACRAHSCAISSVASFAAFTASVLGMTISASPKAWTASCSLVPSDIAKSCRWRYSAVSTAPPPTTSDLLSITRCSTHTASWNDRSISCSIMSLAPRSTTDTLLSSCVASPSKNTKSSAGHSSCPRPQSPRRRSSTHAQWPSADDSSASLPSRSLMFY